MNEEDAQAEIKKKAAGQIVLTWLWEQYADMDYLHDRPLITRMVDLVVSEGHEEMVWDWICNNELQETDDDRAHVYLEWRKTAVCAIAQAKAKDLDGSLDDAIEVAIRTFTLHKTCYIPWAPLDSFLVRQLTSSMSKNRHQGFQPDFKLNPMKEIKFGQPRYPGTSEEMWESYYHFLSSWNELGHSVAWCRDTQAIMWLYHRQRPDPLPFLQVLRMIDDNESDNFHKMSKAKGRNSKSITCEVCAALLASVGRDADARWVEDFVNRRLPETKRNWKRSFISPNEKRPERVKRVGLPDKWTAMHRVNRLGDGKSICANPHHLLLLPNPCPSCGQPG